MIDLVHADSRNYLWRRDLPRFDAIVTDPPYELGFMGKAWDKRGISFDPEFWRLARASVRPGGYLLAFGGTRTFHRIACAVEDAGWTLVDTLMWMHGQGFPKGRSQLKPAYEPIILARAPGTIQPLQIDECRIATGDNLNGGAYSASAGRSALPGDERTPASAGMYAAGKNTGAEFIPPAGRWPANVILSHAPECEEIGTRRVKNPSGSISGTEKSIPGKHTYGDIGRVPFVAYADADGMETVEAWQCADGCPVAELDRQSGMLRAGERPAKRSGIGYMENGQGTTGERTVLDTGGASRFFYTAKASKRERGEYNDHPTVKPLALMRHLVRLVTPPGGLLLDPFAGSGTTLLAAQAEGLSAVGVESDEHSVDIARRRLGYTEAATGQFSP